MNSSLSRRTLLSGGAAVALGALAPAAPAAGRPAGRRTWPTTLDLPDGFHPAGIAIGALPYAYAGSLLGGEIHRIDLATGAGTVASPGHNPGTFDPDHMSVGLQIDRRGRLFVAGGWGRLINVVDARSGALLRTYHVGDPDTAVDHVVLTPRAAWFTDSYRGQLFGLPLGRDGRLPSDAEVVTLPLSGDWVQGAGGTIAGTGIARTPDGRALLVVDVTADGGGLFRVDPATGVARRVVLNGLSLPTTNGITTLGRTLYAPTATDVTVIRLDPAGTAGTVVGRIEDPRFDVPCAAAVYGNRLYVANSRFGTEPTPETTYNVVAVPLA